MTDSIFAKIFGFLSKNWQTKKGLLISILFFILFCSSITTFSFFDNIYFWLCLILGLFIWFIVWSLLSGRVDLPTNKKVIYLCFDVDWDGIKNYRRVIKKLNHTIRDVGLYSELVIRNSAYDLVKNKSDAHRLCSTRKIDLIIWGKTEYGYREEQKVLIFEVSHTGKLSSNLNDKLEYFLADLTLIFAKRNWTINEVNELEEYKVVSSHFLETILFMIGIYYYDEGHFEKAIKLFEYLLPLLVKKESKEDAFEYKIQSARVRALLCESYYFYGRLLHDQGKVKESYNYLLKIPEKVPNPIALFMVLARVSYLKGNDDDAKLFTDKIRNKDKRHPAVCLNYGFFGIKQKNYDRVRFWYDEFLKHKKLKDIDIFSVITFLDKEYSESPSEHAYLYALGIVNGFLDPVQRKHDLQKFVKLAKNREDYKLLVKRAKELLK